MTDTALNDSDAEARRSRDNARLRRVATRHAAAALIALTLWGVADMWATQSGLFIAGLIALLNALFAATAVAYLAHEWGHFSGARLAGAVSPVMKEPRSFFMFTFKDDLNTARQFLSMSLGGPAANWLLVIVMMLLLPNETLSQTLFVATTLAIAVSVSVFEVPVMQRVSYGADPAETVTQRLEETGTMPRYVGIAVGAVYFVLFS